MTEEVYILVKDYGDGYSIYGIVRSNEAADAWRAGDSCNKVFIAFIGEVKLLAPADSN